jgi:hypothetical protein
MNRQLTREDCEHEAILYDTFNDENFEPTEEEILKAMQVVDNYNPEDFED